MKTFKSFAGLQESHDNLKDIQGLERENLLEVMNNDMFCDRAYYALGGEEGLGVSLESFRNSAEVEGIIETLIKFEAFKTVDIDNGKEDFVDSRIYAMILIESNPMAFCRAVKEATDKLIVERVEACSGYRPMLEAISTVVKAPDYPKYAIAINKKVFGYHETGIKNTATAFELSKIFEIEHYIVRVIEQGFVTDDSGVMRAINTYKL